MPARLLHFATGCFFEKMKVSQSSFVISILFFVSLQIHAAPPVAEDTTSPNTFSFTSDTFYVDEDATSAVVTVEFTPGDRSWTGSVNYSVSNGTATAGDDFTPVSGTLSFSGPSAPLQITIPIRKDSLRESNETAQLFLSNSNANFIRSNATLVIIDKNQNPELRIVSGADDSIALQWSSDFPDFVLEKSSDCLGTNWIGVASPPTISNGFCSVTEPCSPNRFFYRLRKNAAP